MNKEIDWRFEKIQRKISSIRRILNEADERFSDAVFAQSNEETCTQLLDETDWILNKIFKELE
jgi:hypothetical protein